MNNKTSTKARGGTYGVTLSQNIRSCGNNCPPIFSKHDGSACWLNKKPRLAKLKFRQTTNTRDLIKLLTQSTYIRRDEYVAEYQSTHGFR